MLKKIFMGICCFMLALTSSGCEKIPIIKQTTGDYVLNISVSATTFNEGEDIEVIMIFENNSGQEQQITHGDPMINIFTLEEGKCNQLIVLRFSTLEQGLTTTSNFFGGNLKKGRHHLIAFADFSLGWGQNDEKVQVYSNTIIITVK